MYSLMSFIKKQYRINLQAEFYTHITRAMEVHWADTALMQEILSKLFLDYFMKCKMRSAKLLALSSFVEPYNYVDAKTKIKPADYKTSFNVRLCNALLYFNYYNLAPLKPGIMYKFPLDYRAFNVSGYKTAFTFHEDYTVVPTTLVYRFEFCIDFESTDKFTTMMNYIYILPAWTACRGIHVRNYYFSFIRL